MNDLSPFEFDQLGNGWRLLDSEGRFYEAATAIESYITSHVEEIGSQTDVSVQTMYFHAGQEYAVAGREYYGRAVKNLVKSYKSQPGWDLYVEGTVAFLNNDKSALQDAADNLAVLAKSDTKLEANSQLLYDFLKALITGDDYATVYMA